MACESGSARPVIAPVAGVTAAAMIFVKLVPIVGP